MSLLAMAAIPLAVGAAWIGVRWLRGRPVRRFALNAVVGIALLVYFLITAGLGIFWVANQELPVFDPHYLFGYLTVFLVAVHIWINAPLLARFVRTRSRALSADGRRFRPSVAWSARVLGVVGFGGLCYWIGFSRGASVVTVEQGEAVVRPAGARGGGGSGDGARGMRDFLVDGTSLARWYHERSAHSRRGAAGRAAALDWNTRPEPFETYPSRAVVELPRRALRVDMPAGQALAASRDVPGGIGPAKVTLAQLATLLHLTQGITSITGVPGDPFYRRAAASSGALYPTVTHVVVGEVVGVPAGVYHYEPRTHALHRTHDGDVRPQLARVASDPRSVQDAPFTLVLSAIYEKSAWKYEERAYRYCLLDAGHVAANAIAAGAAFGWSSRAIGRFDDAAVGAVFGFTASRQGVFLLLPFGGARPHDNAQVPAFEAVDLALANARLPTSVVMMASRTALRVVGTQPRRGGDDGARTFARGTRVALPPIGAPGDALGPVIERRRSQRRFSDVPIALGELSTILGGLVGGSVEDEHATRVHVVASRVDGLPAGVYEYVPSTHELVTVRTGMYADTVHAAALSQEVSQQAAAIVAISANVDAMMWPDASRGYRYAWLEAGIIGGRAYLQGVALGVGVSSIGAFFDDDMTELLALDPKTDLPALLVALGK